VEILPKFSANHWNIQIVRYRQTRVNNTSTRPGNAWLDTQGKPIQAHGGSVFYKDACYYWYGENKEETMRGKNIWHWGVRCYVSTDLYNWDDKRLTIRPDLDDPTFSLYPGKGMDRPHILYNESAKICVPVEDHGIAGTKAVEVQSA
jgi:hypothetical protein